jgi:hypothetical protein
MKRLRTSLICASLAALVACDSAPRMTETEARSALRRLASDHRAVCSADGRAQLRQAARAYSNAMKQKGELWPSVNVFLEEGEPYAQMEILVIGAMMYGLLTPSDLGGDAPRIRRAVNDVLPAGFKLETYNIRDSQACGEVFDAFEDVTRTAVDQARLDRQIQRAARRGDHDRLSRLAERRGRLVRRMEKACADLREALERVRV